MTATIDDVTKVGDVVDALKSLVGEELTLQGVSFSYKDPEAVMADARTAALANAKVRAEQYAEAAGVELGGVLRIVEGASPTPVQFRELAAAGADGRRRQGRRRARVAGPRRRRQRRLRDALTHRAIGPSVSSG